MPKDRHELKLGKGAGYFVKSQLRRLDQKDETWEADFRVLPKPIMQTATHYLGLVLAQPHGDLLAFTEIEQTPAVNDFANLLADAMRRPCVEGAHRPTYIHLRGNPHWKQLFSHLKGIGIEVVVQAELPLVNEAHDEFLQERKQARPSIKLRPTKEQASVVKAFPAIAKWVQGCGHIEIGDQEGFGFVVRALDYGGLVFENDKTTTMAEAMAALEKGLIEWFDKHGKDLIPRKGQSWDKPARNCTKSSPKRRHL